MAAFAGTNAGQRRDKCGTNGGSENKKPRHAWNRTGGVCLRRGLEAQRLSTRAIMFYIG